MRAFFPAVISFVFEREKLSRGFDRCRSSKKPCDEVPRHPWADFFPAANFTVLDIRHLCGQGSTVAICFVVPVGHDSVLGYT